LVGIDKHRNLVRLQVAVYSARIDLLQALRPTEQRSKVLEHSIQKLARYERSYPDISSEENPYRRAYEAGILDYQDLFAIARDDLDERLLGFNRQDHRPFFSDTLSFS